ncbi:efflux RND transporter permease subunit [Paenibacillus sp. LHD-117]|uniref:efflux RND transporter permease subunit n=1 Tax=Paenibacillus sp. LHD-117 TaxID=3071412 RepID=UPI0027DF7C73|nr:efflux RND transporter permease subunit [Paenibacillus sp. LHD-117]MDQ6420881.1 efflux RND transporter permease subunit [Paenibacillus sp. LHD-117]
MNRITGWSFRNKAAIGLLVVMALAMGIISYFRLPMEFLPAADNPQVMITSIGQGINAKTMEQNVTKPLEEAVLYTKGKTSAFSTSGDGYSQINLNFDASTDMKEAKAEVERAVASVQLPENVMKPFVVQFHTSMIPIAWVTFTFDDSLSDHEREERLTELKNELQGIEGTGQISVSGGAQPAIHIIPSAEKLADAGIPVQSLMGVLQGRGVHSSIGDRSIDGQAASLNVYDEISSLDSLKKLPVAPGKTLADVATVELAKEQESISRMNGRDAVMMTISKAADANAVTVGKQIEKTIEEMNDADNGVNASMLLSSAESVEHSVNSMLREVLLGALFATIVILLFMRNFKATIVTIVSIPLSLGITLYLLQLSGVTLNIITLGGVAVAVGRLVDDSIVVIENIYRRLQKETFSVSLITDATKEVASAITSSTIVTVAVFLPMGLLRGSLQAFLLPFALTVTYSLLASLIVALTVVPLLSAWLLRGTKEKEHAGSPRFASFLAWNLRHKWIALTLSVILLAGSVSAYVLMPKAALDSSSAENLNVTLEYPSDTPEADVLTGGTKLESYLIGHEGVEWTLMSLGNSSDAAQYGGVSSPTLVSFIVDMKEGADAEAVMEEVRAQSGQYPEAELLASASDLMMGGGSTTVFIDVTGEESKLADAAGELEKSIAGIDGVLKVESSQEELKPVYAFRVNPELAKGGEIAQQLQGTLNPLPIGTVGLSDGETPVWLQPVVNPASENELNALTVMTEAGPVPISTVAELVRTEEPTLYYHKEGKPYLRVTASVAPDKLSVVGKEIQTKTGELVLPEGVEATVGGASTEQSSDFADLGITALISIGLVYLIMVLTFKTLRAPLAIMISLPLAAIGAVTGLLVSGVTPDFTAMFGALMLIGIVVTNAIVLIDRVKQNEETMTIRDSLIEAATTRMRPIIMTALATICAMLPLVFGSHESGSIVSQSLAIVVIGGLAAATLLTLVIVPCVYELLFFRKSRKQRKAASGALRTEAAAGAEA